MAREYECDIIGDGKSPATAFRPAIADWRDPVTGHAIAFSAVQWPTRVNGSPVGTTAIVRADPVVRVHNLLVADPRIRAR